MPKKAYVYEYLDVCDPHSRAYHSEGGLLVITSGYPNDAVPTGTGNRFKIGDETKYGLPEADHKITVPDDTPDLVVVFPDSGCC